MRPPPCLELRQQAIGQAHGVGIAGDALGAAVLALRHQPRPFEHGHVLLHGGERHVVVLGQLADRGLRVHHAVQDVAPRGVGERPEELIQGFRARLLSYNHLVVDPMRRRWRLSRGTGMLPA